MHIKLFFIYLLQETFQHKISYALFVENASMWHIFLFLAWRVNINL